MGSRPAGPKIRVTRLAARVFPQLLSLSRTRARLTIDHKFRLASAAIQPRSNASSSM